MNPFVYVGPAAAVLLAAGLWLTWIVIGKPETGRHSGRDDFDWRARPILERLPDRLDRLASAYTIPRPLLAELLRTDRVLASIDALLRPVTR